MINLKEKCRQIRRDILKASYEAGACHIGSALSCVEIMVDLFYGVMGKNDQFIFSKASGAATYYAVLADKGYFPKRKLAYYLKNYPLASKKVPGVLHSVGSLGMGLSVAVGLTYADRNRNVYCLISDGELEEGNTWEAILSKRKLQLKNLFIYVDYNKIGACKRIKIPEGFLIESGINIVHTTKGNGVDFMENSIAWHYRNLSKTNLEKALKQI
jgi:transketolase